jgi:hypothetical protein
MNLGIAAKLASPFTFFSKEFSTAIQFFNPFHQVFRLTLATRARYPIAV